MTPEAPLDIAKGQDEKGKNALSPDLVQGTESLNQYLEPFIFCQPDFILNFSSK